MIEGNEIVAFHPNQIKLASNANPSDNVDIRFSESFESDEWAESLSRSKEFAVKFTENIDTNGIYFNEQEYRIIQEALKNGNGKVQAEGVYGTVTSALYTYTFKILSNNDVIVLDYSPREEYDDIENEILNEVYYDGSYENGSYGNEKTRSQRRNGNEYGVPFAETGNGRGSFEENFRESVDEQDGNNGNGRKNGGLRLEDAKVKPWKSYESVAKIKEKIKYGFKLTASEKSILDSKGISYPAENSDLRFSESFMKTAREMEPTEIIEHLKEFDRESDAWKELLKTGPIEIERAKFAKASKALMEAYHSAYGQRYLSNEQKIKTPPYFPPLPPPFHTL